jgi:hypothetical protein
MKTEEFDGSSTTSSGRAKRKKMRSPGHPPLPREVERLFWIEIAKGLIPAAAIAVGSSQPVGQRWFHNAGGMPPFSLEPLSGRYLSFHEREEIALLIARGAGVRQIARTIGRDASTISRELRRNAATRVGDSGYRASVAQWKAESAAKHPKPAKPVTNPQLRVYVEERLSSQITRPDGVVVAGPPPPRYSGNGKPHRKHRAWVRAWSPEQISQRIKLDFSHDECTRISHEERHPRRRACHSQRPGRHTVIGS